MDGIIDNVLGLARAGRDIGDTAPVALDRVALVAWDAIDAGAASLDADDPGRYDADEDRLVDVFSNLFRNAVEHGGDDVRVTVGRRRDGDGFYVADDGAGFSADPDAIFDRGVRRRRRHRDRAHHRPAGGRGARLGGRSRRERRRGRPVRRRRRRLSRLAGTLARTATVRTSAAASRRPHGPSTGPVGSGSGVVGRRRLSPRRPPVAG
ncbi:ATP-binding protein [Halobaculum litoreum]|uniref:histidine kinase n=1 Tax=Halobaculum litoreum TaxID=3031998 RepID=A0ABD5XQ31_9EURY